MLCGGDYVTYEMWGVISASRGAISVGLNVLKFWIDSKKYYFEIKTFDALSTPWFVIVTKFIEHTISDWWRNNQTNIVQSNISLHQLPKTTEIIAG